MQEIHTIQANLDDSQTRPLIQRPRIAYLLSQYPAVSHTFFLKEILGLKQLGFQIEIASINPPDRPLDRLPSNEEREARATYYIKTLGLVKLLPTMIGLALRHPIVCI